MHPYYIIRWLGGVFYLLGALLMAYNVWMTAKGRLRNEAPMDAGQPYNPQADRPLEAPAGARPQPQPQPAE